MSKTHGTNVHVIDGKTYVEVERKANVGEKVINITYCDGLGLTEGQIIGVYDVDSDGFISYRSGGISPLNYRVLVPQESAPTSTASKDDSLDIIANLVRRVNSLERQVDSLSTQLRDAQNNVERQGVEIAEIKHLAESNEEDTRTLDERTHSKDTPFFTTYKPRFYFNTTGNVKEPEDLAKRIAESVKEILKNGGASR